MHQLLRNCVLTTAVFISSVANAGQESTKQINFATPEEAVKELVSSIKDDNNKKLLEVLGPQAKPLLESGDDVEDKANRQRFLDAYQEKNKLDKISDKEYELILGKEDWPFPIHILQTTNGWYFDTENGKEEILNRRVGRNELATEKAMRAYVDAQYEYYLNNPQKDKFPNYARKLMSTNGKRDGLYYPINEGEKESPLGELYANAYAAGYADKKSDQPQPYLGYYFRILESQGPDAKGGAYDYVANGKMIRGHALLAWPANYGNTGIMTFMINHEGKLFEKDFGPDTKNAAQKITSFNPDKSWSEAKESE